MDMDVLPEDVDAVGEFRHCAEGRSEPAGRVDARDAYVHVAYGEAHHLDGGEYAAVTWRLQGRFVAHHLDGGEYGVGGCMAVGLQIVTWVMATTWSLRGGHTLVTWR